MVKQVRKASFALRSFSHSRRKGVTVPFADRLETQLGRGKMVITGCSAGKYMHNPNELVEAKPLGCYCWCKS